MRNTECYKVRREIEESTLGGLLSSTAYNHMTGCAECEGFSEERTKLRRMVAGLGTVAAPDDFEFRLRARLAREKRSNSFSGFFGWDLSFGARATAFAMVLFVVGAVFIYRNSNDNEQLVTSPHAASQPASSVNTTSDQPKQNDSLTAQAGVEPAPEIDTDKPEPRRFVRNTPANRLGTRDLSSSQAAVLRPANLTDNDDVFSINARNQSLKLSVQDGRRRSRTISLPTVSFGSQRSVSQNESLVASARGAW